MTSSPESISSLRSQVSFREELSDDDHHHHGTDLRNGSTAESNVVFAPFGGVMKLDAVGSKNPVSIKNSSNPSVTVAPQSTAQELHYVLGGKPLYESDAGRVRNSCVAGNVPVATPREQSGSPDTTEEFLTQVQLAVPALSTICSKASTLATDEDQSNNIPRIEGPPNLALHYGIDIGLDSRIASRMCKIPKEQTELLDGKEKWFPPLVGAATRLGMIPLPLFNALAARVDSFIKETTTTDVDIVTQDHVTASHVADAATTVADDSPRSADSESVEDWSPSPPPLQKQNQRPPDSPPEVLQITKTSPIYSISKQAPEPATTSEANDQVLSSLVDGHQRRRPSQSVSSGAVNGTISLPDVDSHLREVELVNLDSLPSPRGPVQVDRTPYPVKNRFDHYSPNTSISFIPATFDEIADHHTGARALQNTTPSRKGTDLDPLEPKGPLSQHEDVQFPSAEYRLLDPSIDEHSNLGKRNDNSRGFTSRSVSYMSFKRGSSEVGSPEQQKSKRNRGSSSPLAHGEIYAEVDKTRRTNRRDFYRKISSKRSMTEDQTLHCDSSLIYSQIIPSIEPSGDEEFSDLPTSKVFESVSSTSLPVDQVTALVVGFKRTEQQDYAESTFDRSTFDLYTTFQASYPSYKGKREDFDSACRLLKGFLSRLPIHPQTWDAFVYHHYHDYKPYLEAAVGKSRTIQSYDQFFSDIDDLKCSKRVLTRPRLLGESLTQMKHLSNESEVSADHRPSPIHRPDSSIKQRLRQNLSTHHEISPQADKRYSSPVTDTCDGQHETSSSHSSSGVHPTRHESIERNAAGAGTTPNVSGPQQHKIMPRASQDDLTPSSNPRQPISCKYGAETNWDGEHQNPTQQYTSITAANARPFAVHQKQKKHREASTVTCHEEGKVLEGSVIQTVTTQDSIRNSASDTFSNVLDYMFDEDVAPPAKEEVQQFISLFRWGK